MVPTISVSLCFIFFEQSVILVLQLSYRGGKPIKSWWPWGWELWYSLPLTHYFLSRCGRWGKKGCCCKQGEREGLEEVVLWYFCFPYIAQTGAHFLLAAVCLWEQSCCRSIIKPRETDFTLRRSSKKLCWNQTISKHQNRLLISCSLDVPMSCYARRLHVHHCLWTPIKTTWKPSVSLLYVQLGRSVELFLSKHLCVLRKILFFFLFFFFSPGSARPLFLSNV